MNGSRLDPRQAEAFIRANTEVMAPPHVPEIRLHLASEAHELWQRTEEELAEIGLPPPFWAFAWAGGQGLARHILDNPGLVAGRRVLDLATGSGLVAIAAARAGAASVTACDIDPFCATALRLNAAGNGVDIAFDGHDPIGTFPDIDLLLAGDVFYDRELSQRLMPWFASLRSRGIEIIIGDPGRAYLPKAGLQRLATYHVPTSRALEDAEIKATSVWRSA